jgi:hypothetical protein
MQVVGRKAAAILHLFGRGLARRAAQVQARLLQRARALAQVAGRTGGHHVFPEVIPPRDRGSTWSKVRSPFRAAILAAEFVPQKKIEARECHALLGFDEIFQHDDRGYAELCLWLRTTWSYSATICTRSRKAALIASCQGQSD